MDDHVESLSSEASAEDILPLEDLERFAFENSDAIVKGKRNSDKTVPVFDISAVPTCSNVEPQSSGHEGLEDLNKMILEAGIETLFDITIATECDEILMDLQDNQGPCFESARLELRNEQIEESNNTIENQEVSHCSDVDMQMQEESNFSSDEHSSSSVDNVQMEEESAAFCSNRNSSPLRHPSKRLVKKRKPIADAKNWTRNKAIAERCKGAAYMGFRRHDKRSAKKIIQDVLRVAREMGPPCKSAQCRKWSTRRCGEVSENLRSKLFHEFWNKMSWGEKKIFICSLVKSKEPKQRTVRTCRRSSTYFYHLKEGSELIPVCQKMFLSTFGLKNSTIRYWLASFNGIGIEERVASCNEIEERGGTGENQPAEEVVTVEPQLHTNSKTRHEHLQKFLNEFPKVPSHYCRQSSERLYVQSDIRSKSHLYELYCKDSRLKNIKPLNRHTFDRECKQKKISIYQPRKDQCDLCFQYKMKNLGTEEYEQHVLREKRAQKEKEQDKIKAQSGIIHLITCDVMAVKLLPQIKASIAYYKMKLAMHNFSVYNLATHDAMCYWFSEVDANLEASTFASCLVHYIEELLQNSQDLKDVVIYSDGCTYQNRNAVLSNALLLLSMKHNVVIYQKFLEKGHTYMEVDSVHSVIEGAMKGKELFLPSNLVQVTLDARKKPFPYRAKLMKYDMFTDYSIKSTMRYESIRPGNKINDPVVTDLRCLKYDPAGSIAFKTNFDSEYMLLPRRPKQVIDETKPLLNSPLRIPKDKWTDLLSLKPQIPYDCFDFYKHLPHQEESYRSRKKELKKSSKD